MSGSLNAVPPGLPINDFSGRRAIIATVDNGGGQHMLSVNDSGGGAAMDTPEAAGITLAVGGTAEDLVVSFDANSRYLIIQNPPDAASQGIATAENVFVALGAAAVVNGALNYAVLAPGNCCAVGFSQLRPGVALTVSVNAATTGHKILATHFFVAV